MIQFADDPVAEDQEATNIDNEMRSLWLIWAVEMAIVVCLSLVLYMIGFKVAETKANPILPAMQIILGIISVFSLVFAYRLRKAYLTGRFKQHNDIAAQVAALRKVAPYITKYRSGIFYPMLTPVAVAIYGLILFVLGAGPVIVYAFLAASVIGLIQQRPNREEMMKFRTEDHRRQITEESI
ncbi:MAG: hypothetical protein JW720_02795 [Sedimentisphaerales bacterium]|nr:hypothetical protein [Sedimentisphaerales bacterium]